MAERRMFSKTIVESDAFVDMPLSTQALYLHISMAADDDGFVNNPKRIQRMIGATDDDLRLLLAKKFIIAFESGIVVVKHWRLNNQIQKDRYKETVYLEEKSQLQVNGNKSYTLCIQNVSSLDTQYSIDKLSKGKSSKEEDKARANDDDAEIVPDDNFAEIYTAFENELGRPLSIIESEKIIEWHKTMKKELILEALKRAVLNNVKTMQYIGGILNSWEKSGLKCLNDVLEADKRRERNKKAAGGNGKTTSNRSFRGGQEDLYSDEIYENYDFEIEELED